MSPTELSFTIIAIILLMLASIFFSLSETSIISQNRIRLKGHLSKGRKNASIIKEMLDVPENFLAAILIGNNIVNITISVLVTVVVIHLFGPNAITIATIVATLLIVAFAEITPKAYAARNPGIAYKLAPVMKFLIWILKPLIIFFTGLTNVILRLLGVKTSIKEPIFMREDLGYMIEIGEEEGIIQKEERHLLKSALDFSGIKAGDIMIPFEKVTCIDAGATLGDAVELVRRKKFARIPVINEGKILGFVHIKDALNNLADWKKSIKEIARPALFANPGTSLLELVDLIKGSQSSMCFVIDEEGKPLGLITLGLLLENIVGEIKQIE
ncbi:MAG: hemolysin family protein [Candidatus Methanoperedens sp.]|nr:hemolysin family protein [Candidatus Methanoperedens sp.]MCZ7394624.1 hemolysin family protein [Candidatus Methanoperedens sp.]